MSLQPSFGFFTCNRAIVLFLVSSNVFFCNRPLSAFLERDIFDIFINFPPNSFIRLVESKKNAKGFFLSHSGLKIAMVSFKLSNQKQNDNIQRVYYIAKLYKKSNLVARVLNLLNKIWRKKMFYNGSSAVKTFLLSLILVQKNGFLIHTQWVPRI